MKKPVLLVMAAGMGSRFGGLKQVVAVGAHNQSLMEYSLFDAKQAGFEEVVFVISKAMKENFPQYMQERIGKALSIRFAMQEIDDIPTGFTVPPGRVKPWGTGHAVLAARHIINSPMAVINADDYYGPSGLSAIYDFLTDAEMSRDNVYAMVGYALSNTLSENGYVARGICRVDDDGWLAEIKERGHIISTHDGALYTDDQQCYHKLPDDALASMNLWGFPADFMHELEARFQKFLEQALTKQSITDEYFLPDVVGALLREAKVSVRVLPCNERWYGMTHANDKDDVVEAIRQMTEQGLYPERLWA